MGDLSYILNNHIPLPRPYNDEDLTVWGVRLLVHFTACIMMFAGYKQASHPFAVANRRLMVVSFVASFTCWVLGAMPNPPSFALHVMYKTAEACIASIVLSGCFLIHALLRKEVYRLTSAFYLSLGLYALALVTNNTLKVGYLANAVVSGSSFHIMWQFWKALGPLEGPTALALVYLEAVLTALNVLVFVMSLWYAVFGPKVAVYVLYLFRVTVLYMLVRPHLQVPDDAGEEGGKLSLKNVEVL